eukprot:m.30201 g.30201  ORF g.30201 m.30201 type:complete len:52 (-) comp4678_c0_seq1:147-302(-)
MWSMKNTRPFSFRSISHPRGSGLLLYGAGSCIVAVLMPDSHKRFKLVYVCA